MRGSVDMNLLFTLGEVPATRVAQSLNDAARTTGFVPKLSVVEITGTCAHCHAT